MKKKLLYGLALILTVAGVIGFVATNSYAQSFLNRGEETAPAAAEAAAALPPVSAPETVIVEARVVPNRAADLSMASGGIVAQILVTEGSTVTAGAPLVQLNNARQRAAVAQAEANLRNAAANLANLQAPPRPEEIARYQASITSAQAGLQNVLDGPSNANLTSARVDLANAEAALRQAQADYDEVGWRNDVGMLPQATALEQATNNYVRAQAAFDELQAGADADDVTDAQARVRSAQAELDLLLAGATPAAIAAAEATVAAAQAALTDAQVALDDMTLVAPFDGIVAALNVETGEQVSPGVVAVKLADIATWRIETEDLTELNVVNIQIGDEVKLTFDALPGEQMTGRVAKIRPLGEDKLGDITYTVAVELDKQDSRLLWNMTAEAVIEPGTASTAGRQPASAPLVEPAPQPRADALALAGSVGAVAPAPETAGAAAMAESAAQDAASAAPIMGTVTTLGANLNVRSAPNTAGAIVTQAAPGTRLTVLARNTAGDWLQVEAAGGQTGWVAAAYVALDGAAETLPLAPTTPAAQPDLMGPAASIEAPAAAAVTADSAAPAAAGDALPQAAGRPLVFQASSGGMIYAYNLAQDALWSLTTGMDPALSPDGQTVAFVREGGENGLYLVGIDGSNLRRIYGGGEGLRSPAWSSDGRQIVFSRVTGDFACREVPGGSCLSDNPFLSELPLVGKDVRGLSVVDADGNNFRDLPALTTAEAPSWGQAGIIYASRAGLQITQDAPGATTRPLVDSFKAQDPAWSPDGSRVVFQSKEGDHREIFVVNADGSGAQPLTRPADLLAKEYAQNVAPVWSQDGRQIAFLSNRSDDGGVGAWGIWLMDGDGSNLRRLSVDVALDYRFQAEQALAW